MKKNLLSGFTGLFLALIISIIAKGQLYVTSMKTSKDIASSGKSGLKNILGTVDRNNVNLRAVRNFVRSYKHVSNEKWYELRDGFVAKFTLNDVNYRVEYEKKGGWLQTIRDYSENKLPIDVRHFVKSSYYDYNITLVQEIEKPLNTLTYIIHMEGKINWINLRVCNGEMEEWQKFNKSK